MMFHVVPSLFTVIAPRAGIRLSSLVETPITWHVYFAILFLIVITLPGQLFAAGNVHDEADRASALAIAAHMPGVKDVRDEIQVAPVSHFDDDLRVNIARAIYGDPTFTMYANDPQAPIRIVVDRGHVTLEGVVNSQVDKQLAQSKAASVPGSFSITNNLVVAGRESAKKN